MLTIEHPLTGEKLQIANRDFANKMTWDQATEACEKLGSGWRLPSVEELEEIYEQLYKKGEGNFLDAKDTWYWSGTIVPGRSAFAFCFRFNPKELDSVGKEELDDEGTKNDFYVRAVRSM